MEIKATGFKYSPKAGKILVDFKAWEKYIVTIRVLVAFLPILLTSWTARKTGFSFKGFFK